MAILHERPSEGPSPFHHGQMEVQRKVGVRQQMEELGRRVIREYMTDQAKQFFADLPLLFVGVRNDDGHVWATTLSGQPGFLRAEDKNHLHIKVKQAFGDPAQFRTGSAFGSVGVMQHNRRRNKVAGTLENVSTGSMILNVEQSVGNCPKYIQVRKVVLDDSKLATLGQEERKVTTGTQSLGSEQQSFISRSDTFFLATSFLGKVRDSEDHQICDCNHRGGAPGFVKVDAKGGLIIPDYVGNSMFQSYGNISASPSVGLQFIDFSNGDTLQLTGTAQILFDDHSLPGAQRALKFQTKQWVHIKGALPIQTEGEVQMSPYNPIHDPTDALDKFGIPLTGRWEETHDVTTFEFLPPTLPQCTPFFEAGQFASFDFPDLVKGEILNRTWTISSHPSQAAAKNRFTISVKKQGLVSGWLHENLKVGQKVIFRGVDGDFTFDKSTKSIPKAGVLLIAGGIGVTQMRVLLTEAIQRDYPVTLLYTIRTVKDAAFLEEFKEKARGREKVKLAVALTADPKANVEGVLTLHGRANGKMVKEVCPDVLDREVFQCGPLPMMNGIESDLQAFGLSATKLHRELFSF